MQKKNNAPQEQIRLFLRRAFSTNYLRRAFAGHSLLLSREK